VCSWQRPAVPAKGFDGWRKISSAWRLHELQALFSDGYVDGRELFSSAAVVAAPASMPSSCVMVWLHGHHLDESWTDESSVFSAGRRWENLHLCGHGAALRPPPPPLDVPPMRPPRRQVYNLITTGMHMILWSIELLC
jgi:hypothetical protein